MGSCDMGEFAPLKLPPYAIQSHVEGDQKRWNVSMKCFSVLAHSLILLKVVPDVLNVEKHPLIVFINKKSGTGSGFNVLCN